jgi:iron(III) transport system permease protein
LPAVSGAFLYWLVRGFEAFEGPLILGVPAGIRMFGPQIYELIYHRMRPEYQEATALSVVGVLLMCPLMMLQWRHLAGRVFWTVGGRGHLAGRVRLGRLRRPVVVGLMLYVMIAVVLPVGQLLLGSLSPFFGFYYVARFGWRHYQRVLSDSYVVTGVRNTFLASGVAATATLALSLAVAWMLTRRGERSKLAWAVNAVSWLPLLVPGVVLGLALLWAYAFAPRWLELYGSVAGFVVAYVILALPVAVRTMQGALAQVASELEEAARVCGAGQWVSLIGVTLPLVWRSLAAAWVLCFLLSAREGSASLMLSAPGAQVLAVTLVYLWSQGRVEEVAALGVVMVVPVMMLRYLVGRLGRREQAGPR